MGLVGSFDCVLVCFGLAWICYVLFSLGCTVALLCWFECIGCFFSLRYFMGVDAFWGVVERFGVVYGVYGVFVAFFGDWWRFVVFYRVSGCLVVFIDAILAFGVFCVSFLGCFVLIGGVLR